MTPNGSLPPTPDAQASAQAALSLRPLPLGELLDRAFNLYFRNFAAFTALLAIVLVPSLLVSYFQTRDILDFYMTTFQHVIQSPTSPPDLSKLAALAPSDTLTGIQIAIAVLGVPLSYGAVVVGVSQAYLGLPVRFAESYRYALRRWFGIIILIVLWFIAAVVAVLSFAFVAAILIPSLAAIGALLGKSSLFAVPFAIFMIAFFLAAVGVFIMLYLTSAVSFIAVVLERVDPVKAFGGAFARVFGGQQFWRGFALAMALTGISIGIGLVTGGAGVLLTWLLKSPAFYFIFAGLSQVFFYPLAIVAAAVYYYDIRIRREGYDLQMLLERFSTPTLPAAPSA